MKKKSSDYAIEDFTNGREPSSNETFVYYTHGDRQYYGTAKYHKIHDCPHLKRWKPSKGFAKVVLKHIYPLSSLDSANTCKTCWKLNK